MIGWVYTLIAWVMSLVRLLFYSVRVISVVSIVALSGAILYIMYNKYISIDKEVYRGVGLFAYRMGADGRGREVLKSEVSEGGEYGKRGERIGGGTPSVKRPNF